MAVCIQYAYLYNKAWKIHTVDQEIFAVKIINVLNFRVKDILALNGSTMQHVYIFYFRAFNFRHFNTPTKLFQFPDLQYTQLLYVIWMEVINNEGCNIPGIAKRILENSDQGDYVFRDHDQDG